MVEGIAEAMLLPEFAKIVLRDYDKLPQTLEDGGVSVINMNGIYFCHFMHNLFVIDILRKFLILPRLMNGNNTKG